MTPKIMFRWLAVIFIYVLSLTIYRFFIGPLPTYTPLATPLVLLTLLPVAYLSLDWKYIQTTRFGGTFGEANGPVKGIVSIPGTIFNSIVIRKFEHRRAHLGRWVIFTQSENPMTIFYDRLTKKWYYHLRTYSHIAIIKD